MVWWSILQIIIIVFVFAHMIHCLNKLSFLYAAFCKVLSEKTLARFKTLEAYNALMELIGPEGEGVSKLSIFQWIRQFSDPESTNEKEQMNINETLLSRVNEFVEKYLSKRLQATAGSPQYYASNLNLMNLLTGTQRNRSGHLSGNTFLLVCECEDCKTNDSTSSGNSAKS
ncbi:uncharacterized protein LOC110187934 isoform X2 [Drosophila serrata]|nr:uncharacterized protein LOC110187934 isoform X2 [Drosophila serrata]